MPTIPAQQPLGKTYRTGEYQYRIRWTNLGTGESHVGTVWYKKQDAEANAQRLNKMWDSFNHEVVPPEG